MTTKRGALIGCGFFARNHMNAWVEIEGATIVAVCDRDRAKAEAMARHFGIAGFYDNAQAMLAAEEIDFIDIATTPQTHRPLVELACRHGKATICQKPFAETMTDAHAMVTAADVAGVPLLVHENFRWQEPFLRMRVLIEAGHIGRPHFARFSFRHGYDNYRNQPYLAEIERFTLMDVGPHLFDLARLFLGDVASLSCRTQKLNPIVRGEDAFTSLLGHENGAVSVVDCSFFAKLDPEPFPQTIAWIEGETGTLALDEGYRLTLHGKNGREVVDVEPQVPSWGEKPWHAIQDSVVQFQRHVVDVLHGRAEPQPSGADNLKTLALALASYEAAETGQSIAMRDWQERA